MAKKTIGGVDAVEAGLNSLLRQGDLSMNNAQFKGNWKVFKGELKKKWGQFTDNDLLEAEGDFDKFLGVVQKRYGDRKEEVERWAREWHERAMTGSHKATEPRNPD